MLERKDSYFIVIRIPVPLDVDEKLTSIGLLNYSKDKKDNNLSLSVEFIEEDGQYISLFVLPKKMVMSTSVTAQFGICSDYIEWNLKDYIK